MNLFKREPNKLECPVCDSNSWILYKVALDRHRAHFLRSRMMSIEGPWGTCSVCRNHFSLGSERPRLLDRPGGLPVETTALITAQRRYLEGQRDV